ncbi:MAG: hypothetical protein Kow0089_01290 [Desulfobulbaceae bacterium]
MIQLTSLPKFYSAVKDHRRVEQEIHRLLKCNLQGKYIARREERTGLLRYTQKNFFSILFLSIYQALGMGRERRLFYGQINHCLRGLVTGTDNLLDNEYKEMLPLAFPETATRFKSVMHILLFDRFLFQVVERAVDAEVIGRGESELVRRRLFEALVPIGAEESQEEGGVTEILAPEEILSSVHMYKGGKLLCLAFVAPLLIEKELHRGLAQAEKGIYSIGMALQMIDDLTDFHEDIEASNHNYLVSTVYHLGTDEEKKSLSGFLETGADPGPIETAFPHSTRLAMHRAITEALEGFDILNRAGYWMTRSSARKLIRYLFRLRGVERLLPFFPEEEPAAAEEVHVPGSGRPVPGLRHG